MKEDNNNFSSELNADISYPHISSKASFNKGCASHILPSSRDQNLYKKFELFLSKNKFHLNNDYDKNNAQIFLKEKNQFLANVILDDYIEGEEEKTTLVDQGSSTFIKNTVKKTTNSKKNNNNNNNNTNLNNKNINVNNKKNNNQINNVNINNNLNKNNDNKRGAQNQSFEGGTMGGPPGSLFDTGKADLLCLLLGMSNK